MKIDTPSSHVGPASGMRVDASLSNGNEKHFLSEHLFNKILRMEQKRAVRSHRPVILLVLDAESVAGSDDRKAALLGLASVLPGALRHTDVTGWYEQGSSLGVLLTEIGSTKPVVARRKVTSKIAEALGKLDGYPWAHAIGVTARSFGNGSGTGSEGETVRLGHILRVTRENMTRTEHQSPRGSGQTSRSELLLVGGDTLVAVMCLLLVGALGPFHEPPTTRHLIGSGCLSLLILLSVSFLFGFYKMERLWLAKNKLARVGGSTATVLGASALWALWAPHLIQSFELFLAQTLLVWLLGLGWKLLYLKRYLKSELDRVLTVHHHKAY